MTTLVQVGGAGVQNRTHHPSARGNRPKLWRWRVPKEDLKRLLADGLGVSEIARRYGVNHSTISRAIRALEHNDLIAVVLGDRCQPKVPEVPTPTLEAPVDVMGEVLSVIEDIRAMRAWLASDEAKAALSTGARVNHIISLFDRRLRWAETFVSTRSKLLELISVDHWLRDMLAIVEEIGRCEGCGEDMHVKDRVLERIRVKLMGRSTPVRINQGSAPSPGPSDASMPAVDESEAV